jgi:transcriptional regulator with XRE-family HTH domain
MNDMDTPSDTSTTTVGGSGVGSGGMKIRWIRAATGMDQATFAQAIGVSDRTIVDWETNRASPRAGSIRSLAAFLDLPGDDLKAFLNGTAPLKRLPAPMRKFFAADSVIVNSDDDRVAVALTPESAAALKRVLETLNP